ncbi:MAG TPA: VWA domain-containing protein [Pyrinomonadaceae bacterium]|nr:VWA domain-containing protein [Pyrinomonadaceae bacterium]
MFFRKEISRALIYGLGMILLAACVAAVVTRAQENQGSAQDGTRQRRSDTGSQVRPTPTPVPGQKDDDVALDSDDVVRVETDLTNILFTAVDKNKRFITEMRKEDIRIMEDGASQEIFTFERQTNRPLSLALLIDTSISEERTLPAEKRAAAAFVDSVIRPDKDEVAVISFTGESTLEQGLTGNIARIRRALERVEFVPPAGYIGGGTIAGTPPISGTNQSIAGSTAIWDSVWVTSEDVLSQTSDKTRRAIILLTDGQDTSSRKKMNEAIERAIKNDVVIYAIGIGDRVEYGIDEGSLKKIAERTGGRAFFPDDEQELRAAFAQIELELRSQFLVAYSPTNKNRDGSFRKVQIEIVNPDLRKQSLRLNYRQGYFARTVKAGKD